MSSIDTGSSFICSRLVNVDGLLNHFVMTRLSRVQWELSVDTVGNSPAYVYLHDTVYINFKVSEQVQTFQIFFIPIIIVEIVCKVQQEFSPIC